MSATGLPDESATATHTASVPAAPIRTRSSVAPEARRDMPVQENGSRPSPSPLSKSEPRAMLWRAASSSAGCRP